jgi:hypothetical protein
VTNVVLLLSPLDEQNIGSVNDWLESQKKGRLHLVDQYGGNSKGMECTVAIGAFNFLNADAFKAEVFRTAWAFPETVQLLIRKQDDDRFSMYTVERQSDELPWETWLTK